MTYSTRRQYVHTGQTQEVPRTALIDGLTTDKGLCRSALLLCALGVAGDATSSTDTGKEQEKVIHPITYYYLVLT